MGRFIEKNDKPWLWSGGGIGAGLAIGFALAHIQTLQEWRWDIIAQPLATLGAGIAAIIAAWIALHNGKKTREQDKEIHEAKSRAEQESILRERFTSIVEMLSINSEDYTKRESGAYALAALADDWATFYKYDQKSALREQQVCLNILTSQLHDPLTEDSPPQLPIFKRRVQDIIFSRFINQENNGPGTWSDLSLDLSKSSLYNPHISGLFNQRVSFSETDFSGTEISFTNAQFHKEVDLSGTYFWGHSIIRPKMLHPRSKSIHFDGTYFGDKVIFTEAVFENAVAINFTKAKFTKELTLSQLNTHPIMLFKEAEFHKGIKYASELELELGMRFRHTEGQFDFERARFNLSEDDPQIKYLKDLKNSFEGAEFGVDFSK